MMNEIIKTDQHLTMSSREIAELTGKQHQHVKRDIQVMLVDLEKDVSSFGRIYFDSMNRQQTEYLLPKDETLCLLSGYDVKARMKIIKRWQELEVSVKAPPQNYLQALEALIETERAKLAAETEVARLQFVCETITNQFKPGMTPPLFCRMLNGVNINQVQTELVKRKMIRKTEFGYRAMPAYRDRYFAEKRGETENGRHSEVVTLTVEGAKRLYKMYLKGELTMKKDWDGSYTHGLFDGGASA